MKSHALLFIAVSALMFSVSSALIDHSSFGSVEKEYVKSDHCKQTCNYFTIVNIKCHATVNSQTKNLYAALLYKMNYVSKKEYPSITLDTLRQKENRFNQGKKGVHTPYASLPLRRGNNKCIKQIPGHNNNHVHNVPEPSSLSLLGMSVFGLAALLIKKRTR